MNELSGLQLVKISFFCYVAKKFVSHVQKQEERIRRVGSPNNCKGPPV